LKTAKESFFYDLFELALSTGMRSGELRGLSLSEVDFDNKVLHIRHSLNYVNNGYDLDLPKTSSSHRDIPMLDNVLLLIKA